MFKRIIIPILIILIFAVGGIVYFLVFQKPTEEKLPVQREKTLEEKLQEVTAPESEVRPKIPKEIIESLTAPGRGEVSEDIIQSLTAPK